MSAPDALYQALVLDHGRHPRNHRALPVATRVGLAENPTCGDECRVHLLLEGDHLANLSFDGAACTVCHASASLMTLHLASHSLAEARTLHTAFHHLVSTGETHPKLGDLNLFQILHTLPTRRNCALLPWQGLLRALPPA